MKIGFLKFATLAAILWGLSLNASALSIDLSTYDCSTSADCAEIDPSGGGSPAVEIANILANFTVSGTLSLLYKSNVDGGSEEGPFASLYSTEYFNTPSDPEDATVSWNGSGTDTPIACPECFLYVKDGSADPEAYAFNLGTLADLAIWNGTDDLVLTNFWPTQGAISHVAIYGAVSPIPVPAAFWLFGTALLGFVGMSRRIKV